MKAICVKDVSSLTKGKEYEVIDAGDGTYWLINDNGNLWCSYAGFFRLAPGPVQEPVNEWMPCGEVLLNVMGNWVTRYINLITGIILTFDKKENGDHVVVIASIHNNKEYVEAEKQYADAFAQMVGYKWEE